MRTKTIAYHLDKRKWKIHQSGIDRAEKYGTGRRQCSSFTVINVVANKLLNLVGGGHYFILFLF